MSERMLCLYSLFVATFKCRPDAWRNFREGRLGSVQHHLGVVLIAREYNPCERCRYRGFVDFDGALYYRKSRRVRVEISQKTMPLRSRHFDLYVHQGDAV